MKKRELPLRMLTSLLPPPPSRLWSEHSTWDTGYENQIGKLGASRSGLFIGNATGQRILDGWRKSSNTSARDPQTKDQRLTFAAEAKINSRHNASFEHNDSRDLQLAPVHRHTYGGTLLRNFRPSKSKVPSNFITYRAPLFSMHLWNSLAPARSWSNRAKKRRWTVL